LQTSLPRAKVLDTSSHHSRLFQIADFIRNLSQCHKRWCAFPSPLSGHGAEKAELHSALAGEMGLDFVVEAVHVGRSGLADDALINAASNMTMDD
jgi:hypothetical protein